MPRVMLIVPSETYRAGEFLKGAIHIGAEIVSASDAAQALATTMGDRFLRLPLSDPDAAAAAIVAFAARVPLDAVVAVDDGGALTAALASERLGLVANAPDAIRATRDKAKMRELLLRAAVEQPAFTVVEIGRAESFADEVASAANALSYPVVIKPTSLAGSRGVIRADDEQAVREAAARLFAILRCAGIDSGAVLVEAFIPGDELALEGLVRHGELEVLAIFDKPDPLDGPYFEETIYVTPSTKSLRALHGAVETVRNACRALGLREGPVHAEVRFDARRDARPLVIEAAARTIGGKCAKALSFSTGATLEELVLSAALGEELGPHEPPAGASGVMMLPIASSGRLVNIDGRNEALGVEGITALEITASLGSHIDALPEASRYLGFLFAKAESAPAVTKALRAGLERLTITIEPDGAP